MAYKTLSVLDMRKLNFETTGQKLRIFYVAPNAGPNGKIGWEPIDSIEINTKTGTQDSRAVELKEFLSRNDLMTFLSQVGEILGQMGLVG